MGDAGMESTVGAERLAEPIAADRGLSSAGPRRTVEIWVPLIVLALDQITKALIRESLPLHDSVSVIPGFLDLTHVRNPGAAFGLFNSVDCPFKAVLIPLVATAALIAVGLYSASLGHHQRLARLGLALIIGGAAGNLIDRVLVGSVVDFVDVYWGTWHFWAFNVADSAITVGVAIMILDMISTGTHVSKAV
jgi:signal peptidase II